MNNKNIFILIISLLVLGTLATIILRSGGEAVPPTKYDTFAQCLASKKLTMYGTSWCSFCKKKKRILENLSSMFHMLNVQKIQICVLKKV